MKKQFYDEIGNKLVYNYRQRIGKNHGINGKIYKTEDETIDDDICIKLFNSNNTITDLDAFKTIIKMNLDNFYIIYKLLYDINNKPKGYVMKYYQQEDIDILTMSIDYTLESFYLLHKSSTKLSEKGILIQDLHDENTILTSNGIIVIDTDNYAKGTIITKERLIESNDYAINYLFKSLYKQSIDQNHYYMIDRSWNIDILFRNGETPDTVHKKLTRYKYPIDYIKANNK